MLRTRLFCGLLLAGLLGWGGYGGWAWAVVTTGQDEPVIRRPIADSGHHHSGNQLDEELRSLLYVKTTDYGATWSPPTAAVNLQALSSQGTAVGDFSAIATASNELCYAVPLLDAPIPGIYSFTGPEFTPVMAMPQGSNNLATIFMSLPGWCDIGRTPNGDLYIVIWGMDANLWTTFWGVRSTDNGTSWGTPFVIASTALPTGAAYPHIADLNSATQCFVQFQDQNYQQYVLRFPTTGGAGTISNLNAASGSEFSYYAGNCKPIAYDPVNNALYAVFRNSTLSGVAIYFSENQGVNWQAQAVTGVQRYPSIALNTITQTPWVFSNYGVPIDQGMPHYAWLAYDAGSYGAGLWTNPQSYASVTYLGNSMGLIYMNEGFWWDANHGVSSHNYWATATPNGLYTNRTTDGGVTWTDMALRWMGTTASLSYATNAELVGGTNGVAWAVQFSAITTSEPVHFTPVDTTAASCTIIVDSVLWDAGSLQISDEIAVFDDTLCVGAHALFGSGPYTLRAWGGDSSHPGYTPGDTLRFRMWNNNEQEERAANARFLSGSQVFADDSVTRVILHAAFGPPVMDAPDSFACDPTAVGRTGWMHVPIWNQGDSMLRVTGVTSSDPVFIPTGSSFNIYGGTMHELSVRFMPVDTVLYQAFIAFQTNDSTALFDTIFVSGVGIARPPTAFHLGAPANGAVLTTNSTRVSWQRSYDPDNIEVYYRVMLDTLADLSTARQYASGLGDTSCAVAGLLDDHAYFWTVQATDNNTAGTWALDTFSFHVSIPDAPLAFHLLSPANGDTLRTAPVTVNWHTTTDRDSGAVPHYDVWVDTLANLATRWQIADSLADTVLTLTNLRSDHRYFWTVRATDNNTPGRWASDTLGFVFDTTIDAVWDAPDLPQQFRLGQNYPNPFNPQTEIAFELPVAAEVRLTVFNCLGQEMTTLAAGRYAPGRYTVVWNANETASGVYLYRLEAGPFVEVKKMLLMR